MNQKKTDLSIIIAKQQRSLMFSFKAISRFFHYILLKNLIINKPRFKKKVVDLKKIMSDRTVKNKYLLWM